MDVAQSDADYDKRGGLFKERKKEKPLRKKKKKSRSGPDPSLLERLDARFNDEQRQSKQKKKKSSKKKKKASTSSSEEVSSDDGFSDSEVSHSRAKKVLDSPKSGNRSKGLKVSKSSSDSDDSESGFQDSIKRNGKRTNASNSPKSQASSTAGHDDSDTSNNSRTKQLSHKKTSSQDSTSSEHSSGSKSSKQGKRRNVTTRYGEEEAEELKARRKSLIRRKNKQTSEIVTGETDSGASKMKRFQSEQFANEPADPGLIKIFQRAVQRIEENFLYSDVTHHVSSRDDNMEIQLASEGAGAEDPCTIIQFFEQAVKNCQDQPALKVHRHGEWLSWSWQEYYFDIVKAAKSIINLGLKRFQSVNVMGANSPEWAIINFGCIFAGGITVGMYPTDDSQTCSDIALRTEAALVFVDNRAQLAKYESVADDLQSVEAFVMWATDEDDTPNSVTKYDIPVYTWEEFLALGVEVANSQLEKRLDSQSAGHCCTFAVAPGMRTYGNQKIAMLSHDNLTWSGFAFSNQLIESFDWGSTVGGERTVSVLPLAHSVNLMMDLYAPLALAAKFELNQCVYWPSSDEHTFSAGTDKPCDPEIVDLLRMVRPTGFHGVPQVYEVLHATFDNNSAKKKRGVTKKVEKWAKNQGKRRHRNSQHRGSIKSKRSFLFGIADAILYKSMKDKVGLEQAKFLLSSNAPLPSHLLDDFGALDMNISECYGMIETSGLGAMSSYKDFQHGAVGQLIEGIDMKILKPKKGDGEFLFRGRNVMMGYLDDAGRTDSVLDSDGWLHTGDIGHRNEDGFIFLLGSMSNHIRLAGVRDVIFPEPIERVISSRLPMVQDCVVIGNKKKHLSLLLTLVCMPEPSNRSQYTDILAPIAKYEGCHTISEAAKNTKYVARIQDAIDFYNKSSLCTTNTRKVKGFLVLDGHLSKDGHRPEMSPIGKPNRSVIEERYKEGIKRMYLPGYDSMKQTSYFGLNQAKQTGKFSKDQGKFLSRTPSSIRIAVASSQRKNLSEIHREEVYKTKRGVSKFVLKTLADDE